MATGFVQVPQTLLALPHGEYKIYAALLAHINTRRSGNRCWPSLATIGKEAGGISADQARRYIHKLHERAEIRIEHRIDQSNMYYLRRLVVNGTVIDGGPDIPAIDYEQLLQRVPEQDAAIDSFQPDSDPALSLQASSEEGAEQYALQNRITTSSDGLASMREPACRSAPILSRICKPNQTKERDEENQKKEQQAKPRDAAQSCLEREVRALLTRLTQLGMQPAEAKRLLETHERTLIEQTVDEACRRTDIQNLPGWILRVTQYRSSNPAPQYHHTSRYIPNAPWPASLHLEQGESTLDSVQPELLEPDSDEYGGGSAENDLTEAWGSTPIASPATYAPVADRMEQYQAQPLDEALELVRRRAHTLLIRLQRPTVRFPALATELQQDAEEAILQLAQHAFDRRTRSEGLDRLEEGALCWVEQNQQLAVA